MIGLPRTGGVWVAALLLGLGAGFTVAWVWQANVYGTRLVSLALAHQSDLTAISNAAAAQARRAVEIQQRTAQALAELDRKYTQEKDKAHADNETLRRTLADGTRRLRITGACNSGIGQLPEATGTTGVGDAGAIELAADVGRHVLDIRAGIIADQAALMVLQEYIRTVCLAD